MKVEDKIDSDHQPVEIWIRGYEERKREGRKRRNRWRGVWDEKGREEFRERVGKVETDNKDWESE